MSLLSNSNKRKKVYSRYIFLCFLFVMPLVLFGCSSNEAVSYTLGIVTFSVQGKLVVDSQVLQQRDVLILAEKEQAQFIKTARGRLAYRQTSLIRVDREGRFFVPFDNETRNIILHIFVRGYKVVNQEFTRTMGITSYRFSPKLQAIPNWKDTFYIMVRPYILSYITESKNGLTKTDRAYLNNWLLKTEEKWK